MPHDLPRIPPKLVEAIIQNRSVLFAGSGISRGTVEVNGTTRTQFLPTWGELLKELINRALEAHYIPQKEAKTLNKAVDDQKYLFVAQAIRKSMGERSFGEAMESIFRNPDLLPTNRHKLIVDIPFSAVITTNYDKLFESAYVQSRRGQIPPTYTIDNAPDIISALSSNRFFILKAHGDIDRKDTITLSERDYRDLIYRQPGYRAALNTIFITRTILFVGASLNDVDVKLVLETVSETFSGKGPQHYALLPNDRVSNAEVDHWRDFFGIHILHYRPSEGHPEVDLFLEKLKREVELRLEPT